MKEFEKQKHFLMDVFKSDAYIPMKKKDLEILLDVEKDKRAEFAQVLNELVDEGQVEVTKRGKYQISENRPKFIKTKDHRKKKPTKAEVLRFQSYEESSNYYIKSGKTIFLCFCFLFLQEKVVSLHSKD